MKNTKSIFFTSDWHIGHNNVLKYDQRPFSDMATMTNALIRRYNSIVPMDGICYFLGDMGNKKELAPVIKQLNGTKVLILGNHDGSSTSMYDAGFTLVLYGATIYLGSNRITLSHCPLSGIKREPPSRLGKWLESNWHGEHKNGKYSVESHSGFHLHGHTHSPPEKELTSGKLGARTLGRQMDVGVRANGYCPVSLSQVEAWIAKVKKGEAI